MPGPFVVPFHGDTDLPQKVDVVVIGGGIIGASTALELAESGLKVALCEKGGIGHEQSSRNWGWVRVSRRDPREIPLMLKALEIWPTLAERTGRDLGFTRSGIAFACRTDADVAKHEKWLGILRDYGVDSHMVMGAALDGLFPGAQLGVKGVLHTPDDARAEPQRAAPAIAEAARARGAHVLTECAVRGIETQAGAVCGIVTERGPIACEQVVLAGGAWSSLFARNSGLRLPQLKVKNSVIRTKPLAGGPECALWADRFALRKRADGGYTIAVGSRNIADIVPDSFRFMREFMPALKGEWKALVFRAGLRSLDEARIPNRWALDEASPFEYDRVLDPKPATGFQDRALEELRRVYPIFAKAEIAQRWAGAIDVTPDAIPVISPIEAIPGFHIATGFSGHGFGIGPAAGRLAADLVIGRAPLVDPAPFRFSRFTDGSRIEILSGF
ncbi:NAD(P)/FAD-dependent oxidoreductase [Falsirhodobacter algicola]|uniref:FAD-dependent oxidoreductase n=1 Tax=Falsirhodobacter algicola TaxID=2692330 RepID=A0A8J8MUU5_9RHOB|nr:FAD-binding oxidoreductase [Falsirhodobacter algicola]QUS36648.1 FAD-dependent oxidoreductase [Falsirhodobacter algicola]